MKPKKQKVIKGDVALPLGTKRIAYSNTIIEGDFSCSDTKITSLKGSPSIVYGSFGCESVYITSFEGAPRWISGHLFSHNTFYITSLHDVHKHVKHVGKIFNISKTVKSHVLGVMFIKGLQGLMIVDGDKEQRRVTAIINKHLPGGNPHVVQEELIYAGLSEYAKI